MNVLSIGLMLLVAIYVIFAIFEWLFGRNKAPKEPVYYKDMREGVIIRAGFEIQKLLHDRCHEDLSDNVDLELYLLVDGEVEKRYVPLDAKNNDDINMLLSFDIEDEHMRERMRLHDLSLHQFMIREACITMYDYNEAGEHKIMRIVS